MKLVSVFQDLSRTSTVSSVSIDTGHHSINSAAMEEIKVIPKSMEVIDLVSSDEDEVPNDFFTTTCDEIEELIIKCMICEKDLSNITEPLKEQHIQHCLDRVGIKLEISNEQQTKPCGLRMKEFYCIICDLDLSRRKLLNRCWHLKQCSRKHNMSTKELLQLIAPVQDFESESKTDDEKEFSEQHQVMSAPSKNVFSVLIQASKQHHQLTGFQASSNSKKRASSGISYSSSGSFKKRGIDDFNHISTAPTPVSNNTSSNKSAGRQWRNAKANNNPGYAPAYKKIQVGAMSLPIVVDGFQYACTALSDTYFLTHFHSDHYMGLTKDFACGKIYCTTVTANLVKLKLKVPSKVIVCLELERKVIIIASLNFIFSIFR
jgi:hypothetical protein